LKEEIREQNIFIKDAALRSGFTQIPNYVLDDAELTYGSKHVYALLLSYAWQEGSCFPGQTGIAKKMGCSVRMIQRFLDELTDRGLIRVKRQGLGKTNLYYIEDFGSVYPEEPDESTPDATKSTTLDATKSTTLDRAVVSYKEDSCKKTQIDNTQYSIYGEFQNVKLTDTEHAKLLKLWGNQKTKSRIELLSAGIQSKGYKYKNYYSTLLNWERRDSAEGGNNGRAGVIKGNAQPHRTTKAERDASAATYIKPY